MAMRDASAFAGLGRDQCRKWQRILGANTLSLVMAVTRTRWFIAQVAHGTSVSLGCFCPGS
jgi:hypothetical protein